MQIRPVGTELFLGERRTHMTKVIVSFRNYAPKNETLIYAQIFTCVTCWPYHKSNGTGRHAGLVISRKLRLYLNSEA
jgi:hypothetical protein